MTAAVQTAWAELIAGSLADAGVALCVISPGSRSTPLVVALAREPRLELVTIIDERAAACFALGAARATGTPTVVACTSGTATAHYLPAIIEASLAGVPLIAVTADRPPELHDCGASQTIAQVGIYGRFVRGAFDLGAPVASDAALRGVRRKVGQAVALARGPHPGPVHVEVPLRKPLEPAAPATDAERAVARFAGALRGDLIVAPPRLAADPDALDRLGAAIAAEPEGVIVAGAMPVSFAGSRGAVFALAERTGYPIIAEAGSQLRFGPRPDGVVLVDHFDLIPIWQLPAPRLVIQLGAEPVAASWPAWLASARTDPEGAPEAPRAEPRATSARTDPEGAPEAPRATSADRWVLAGHTWHDGDSSARAVIVGDPGDAIARLASGLAGRRSPWWAGRWRALETAAAAAAAAAIAAHPRSEGAVIRAAIDAMPAGAAIQIGNSLPIRVVDHVACAGSPRAVLTQRGAAGIDGLIASAAGATRAGRPVLLVLGDVSFAHDVGGLLAARAAGAPLAIVVIDNRGGQIFAGLPIARASLAAAPERAGTAFEDHWITAPGIDPAAVAAALGARAVTAASPAAVAAAVATALATAGVTVIHAPVTISGARDVRRTAIELHGADLPRAAAGGAHD